MSPVRQAARGRWWFAFPLLSADARYAYAAAGLTRQMAEQWRNFYLNEFARNANNLTAGNGVQLIDKGFELMN